MVKDGREFHVYIGKAQNINIPKYLLAAYQSLAKIVVPYTLSNEANFDNLDVGKKFVGIDGYRYPKDAVITNYAGNEYLDQYRDRKLNNTDCLEEDLINPLISYPDTTTKVHIQVRGLRHQVDHITPENIQLFAECRNDCANARLFKKSIRYRQIEMISDGKKVAELKVI